MTLNLSEKRETYQEFYGRNIEQMPKLIADGRVPMNTAQFMQKRLDVRNASEDVKDYWTNNYFDTADAVVYHPDESGGWDKLKIDLDSQYLREMISESSRNGGALILGEDVYNALEGEEFTRKQLGKINESLSRKDIKSHPAWRVLARDQTLLNDYVDFVLEEAKERFGYNTTMPVYTALTCGNLPEMRGLCISGIGTRSCARGIGSLDDCLGLLIGKAFGVTIDSKCAGK